MRLAFLFFLFFPKYPFMPFSSLGFSPALRPALLRAISEKGYAVPTEIQSAAIPAILEGRDIVGSAQTGSGKTAAFALPMLHHIAQAPAHSPRRIRGLVLVPTRELAAQVGESIVSLAQYLPQRIKVADGLGGVLIKPQMIH